MNKVNKQLVGNEVTVSKIKPKGGGGGSGGGKMTGTPRMTLSKLAEIVLKIDKKLDRVVEVNNLKI